MAAIKIQIAELTSRLYTQSAQSLSIKDNTTKGEMKDTRKSSGESYDK